MREYKAVDHRLRYSITGEYPYVDARTRHARAFKHEIALKIVQQYGYATRPDWQEFQERHKLSPKQDPLQTAEFSYEILFSDENLVSIRFHDMTYSYGAAHPLESYFSVNYDLKRGAAVPIASLFRPGSRFMRRLIGLSKSKLDEQKVFTFPDAIETELSRHLEWNVTANGLVINFDRCAVAGCADGERSVLIPYDDLNDILRKHDSRFSRPPRN
jgi:hypothetical protein